jgi:hypothetical protein
MPERLRTVVGILLILAASGVASWQSLLVACSPRPVARAPIVAPD